MKKTKILALTIALAIILVVFAVGNVHAQWMANATVIKVNAGTAGHTIQAAVGTWTKSFIISPTNDWAILSVALTAISTGQSVTIEYTGTGSDSVIDNIWILE